jgi:hypothetical protein
MKLFREITTMGFLNFSYNQLEVICGILFLLSIVLTGILCAIAVFKYKRMKIERFKKATREFSFSLPDRENSFVRDRLRGELRPENEKKQTRTPF